MPIGKRIQAEPHASNSIPVNRAVTNSAPVSKPQMTVTQLEPSATSQVSAPIVSPSPQPQLQAHPTPPPTPTSVVKKIDMEQELEDFQRTVGESARLGLELAEESFANLKNAIRKEKDELRSIEKQQDQFERIENDKQVREQLREIESFEKKTLDEVEKNLGKLKENMEEFTIVLYGRTMAGKSTLMEILTHGNGASIGTGSQRTTRDVRAYKWHGLKIYDVPGTCSFDGEADDALAYETAKSADMALFLLTDDAPQPDESAQLVKLMQLGKPVLGLLNVKQTLNEGTTGSKRKIELKGVEKKINDTERLNGIIAQFTEFVKDNGQDLSKVHFVASHLKAAYLSQPEHENDLSLYELSRFAEVEKFIVDKVKSNGNLVRIKTFIDNVALPMQNIIATMYEHSSNTVATYWSFNNKIGLLREWNENFHKSTQNRYDDFIESLKNQLNERMSIVVEHYYESSNAGDAWKEQIDSLDINRQCQNFIKKISNDATRKMHELSDELTQELRYAGTNISISDIAMEDITDYQTGLMIAAPLLMFTPVGWVGAAVLGIGSLLFGDSKEEKVRQAKKELREKLFDSRNEIMEKVSNGVLSILNEKIFHEQIGGFEQALFGMRDMREHLAYAQYRLANAIVEQYSELNMELFNQASKYINFSGMNEVSLARIVGKKFILISTTAMPINVCSKLSELMGETIVVFKVSSNDYFGDLFNKIENLILNQEISTVNFIDEDWGKMYLISVDDKKKLTDDQIQIVQQLLNDPFE